MGKIVDRLIQAIALRHWQKVAQSVDRLDLASLRRKSLQARALRTQLDQLIGETDGRIALPQVGTQKFARPQGTDWFCRPALWCRALPRPGVAAATDRLRLDDQATLFHDCPLSEITLRQIRNRRDDDLAPFGVQLDVLDFRGSFASLVIDLPPEAARELSSTHMFRLGASIETEMPLTIFARLNIRHGPNTEQIVRELPSGRREAEIDFDLGYSKLNEKRIERLWLDLILREPGANQVVLRDLTLARHRRAAI